MTQRRGAPYSTWFNGGIRTTAHFHNIIGILTETIGNPDADRAFRSCASRQLGDSNLWWPIKPQAGWHMRQSVEYSMTANRAILDYASRYRERVLYNIYVMGRDEMKWGSEDHWTFTPHEMARRAGRAGRAGASRQRDSRRGSALQGAAAAAGRRWRRTGRRPRTQCPLRGADGAGAARSARIHPAAESARLRHRDAIREHADQGRHHDPSRDRAVHRGRQEYPANSYVVKSAQAFRPHVMDMFEPQDHPDDIAYPGAPPTAPYDSTGYTLAFQMGVQFDRILDGFDGPFVKLTDFAKMPAGAIRGAQTPVGLLLQPQGQRQLHRRQPAAGGRRGRLVAVERPDRARDVLRRGEADDAARSCRRPRPISASASRRRRPRRPGRRRSSASCASASTISTAAPCRPAGRG